MRGRPLGVRVPGLPVGGGGGGGGGGEGAVAINLSITIQIIREGLGVLALLFPPIRYTSDNQENEHCRQGSSNTGADGVCGNTTGALVFIYPSLESIARPPHK